MDLLLSSLGERGFLEELARRGLAGPIGDDTASLADGTVVTLDTMVEGVHFRSEWTSQRDLGYKLGAVNLSDLAAAAARPTAFVVGLALPPATAVADALELYEGLNEHGVPVVGGDTVEAPIAVLTLTALGRSARVPGRGGASPGDVVVVTGPLGGAAAGLRLLERGETAPAHLISAHLRPSVRLAEGERLGPVATAMADISDGLVVDAGHIAAQSGCRIEITAEDVPVAPGLAEVGEEPFWAMGEDYELLASVPQSSARELGFPVIGRCAEGSGVAITRNGRALELPGWEHFRQPAASSAGRPGDGARCR